MTHSRPRLAGAGGAHAIAAQVNTAALTQAYRCEPQIDAGIDSRDDAIGDLLCRIVTGKTNPLVGRADAIVVELERDGHCAVDRGEPGTVDDC